MSNEEVLYCKIQELIENVSSLDYPINSTGDMRFNTDLLEFVLEKIKEYSDFNVRFVNDAIKNGESVVIDSEMRYKKWLKAPCNLLTENKN